MAVPLRGVQLAKVRPLLRGGWFWNYHFTLISLTQENWGWIAIWFFQQMDDVGQKDDEKVPVLVDRTSTMWVLLIHIYMSSWTLDCNTKKEPSRTSRGKGYETQAVVEVLCCMKELSGEYMLIGNFTWIQDTQPQDILSSDNLNEGTNYNLKKKILSLVKRSVCFHIHIIMKKQTRLFSILRFYNVNIRG